MIYFNFIMHNQITIFSIKIKLVIFLIMISEIYNSQIKFSFNKYIISYNRTMTCNDKRIK